MAEPASKPDDTMTVEEFLAWSHGDGRMWQLVDGVPTAMAPASRRRVQVQGELAP